MLTDTGFYFFIKLLFLLVCVIMSSNEPPCLPGCLPGELFGGVIAGVVVVTNIISIILTYFITKKRVKDNLKSTNVSLEKVSTVADNQTEPSQDRRYLDTPLHHVYRGDSEFSTDSEDQTELSVPKHNNSEKYRVTSQSQSHCYQQVIFKQHFL